MKYEIELRIFSAYTKRNFEQLYTASGEQTA